MTTKRVDFLQDLLEHIIDLKVITTEEEERKKEKIISKVMAELDIARDEIMKRERWINNYIENDEHEDKKRKFETLDDDDDTK